MLLSILSSCDRIKEDIEEQIVSVEDEATAQKENEELTGITENAMYYAETSTVNPASILADPCVIRTHNTANKTITLDFGTGCTGSDGRVRKGKIIITYTGPYRTSGTVITTTFDNYHVNGNKIEGTKQVENITATADTASFRVTMTKGKITLTDTTSISWNALRTRAWSAGASTAEIEDDVYTITGGSTGISRKGKSFTTVISDAKPVVIKLACRMATPPSFYPVSGEITLKPEGATDRVLDYGSGNCDKEATITINGKVRNITFK